MLKWTLSYQCDHCRVGYLTELQGTEEELTVMARTLPDLACVRCGNTTSIVIMTPLNAWEQAKS